MKKSEAKLKKELGVVDIFCFASGSMISSGLFILPAIVFLKAGPAIILSYIFAAILILPAMVSQIELATAMPRSGGVQFFTQRSLGPVFGGFAGFASWFSLSLKSAFALIGIGAFIKLFSPSFSYEAVKWIASGCTLFFMILNILSVKVSGRFQNIMVFSLLGLLFLYIFLGFGHIDVHRYVPFKPYGWLSVFSVTGMIFISFGGLTKIASVGSEIKDPGKSITKGIFSAFFVVTMIYVLVVFITIGVLDKTEFHNTLTPISLSGLKIAGNIGFWLFSLAAMLAFVTTANAGILSASRATFAMAKDKLLPSFFSRISSRFNTPVISILITSLFMIFVIIFFDLESLVKVASTMMLILFSFVNISVILMRESKIISYKPVYKAPCYPYLQIAGIIAYIILIINMGRIPLLITALFFLTSLLWYFIYSRSRSLRESALIHIVERVTSKEISSPTLSNELREILIERDQIVEDRFDRIIKNATIIDVNKKMDINGLFTLLAKTFSSHFKVPPKKLHTLLHQREQDSTTSIHDGLAIPHIIIEGKLKFDIVLIRSKEGIDFGKEIPPVKIVFSLAGSKKERNFHLTALMAIAQIVQNRDFSN
ncbi:MAG: amino acid permease, partial [Spirochaetes bacterium]|nr:amino acid permease [Spirochaetota bacterium]